MQPFHSNFVLFQKSRGQAEQWGGTGPNQIVCPSLLFTVSGLGKNAVEGAVRRHQVRSHCIELDEHFGMEITPFWYTSAMNIFDVTVDYLTAFPVNCYLNL